MPISVHAENDKNRINLVYANWTAAACSANVVKFIMEKELAYKVEMKRESLPLVWQAVADGNADAMMCAWMPTQNKYLRRHRGNVADLGPNLRGARNGLIVPSYVTIRSINELNSVKKEFNSRILGGMGDWGIMHDTKRAIGEYGLQLELTEGTEASVRSALKYNIMNKQWIVCAWWTPDSAFFQWKGLKFLDDPKKIYGGTQFINTIVRKDLEKDKPAAFRFINKFHWTKRDLSNIILWLHDGMEPLAAAGRWVKENPDKLSRWLE